MNKRTWQLGFEISLVVQTADQVGGVEFNQEEVLVFLQTLNLAPDSEQRILESILIASRNAGQYVDVFGLSMLVFARIFIRRIRSEHAQQEDNYRAAHSGERQEITAITSVPTISRAFGIPELEGKAGGGYFLVERFEDHPERPTGSPHYLIEVYI